MNTMNLNSQEINKSDMITEFEIELEHYFYKFRDLERDLVFGHYKCFLSKTGYKKYKRLPYFLNIDNDIRDIYLEYIEKIKDLLEVKCNTQEHFICILITLEDLICECPFYTDEFKHNEHIKLIEYRINFMNNKNTIK